MRCLMYVFCMLFIYIALYNISSNRGYSKKRLLLPFCKATIKLVYAICRFWDQDGVIFYYRILVKAYYKTLSSKVSLYQSFDLVIIREFKFALKLQQCWTRTDLRCKAMKCKWTGLRCLIILLTSTQEKKYETKRLNENTSTRVRRCCGLPLTGNASFNSL